MTLRQFLASLACWLLIALAAGSDCAAEPGSPETTLRREGTTYVFVCPDKTAYVVRATSVEAWVFRPEGTLRLPARKDLAGTYSDGQFELRIDGDQAEWLAPGVTSQTCVNDRRRAIWEQAKLDGVDFRAVGNEPPWVLEIWRQSRIVLITEYGARRGEFQVPPAVEDRETRTTRWDAGDLRIEVTAGRCHDTMSGEAFESRVTLIWAGKTLHGCGRALH